MRTTVLLTAVLGLAAAASVSAQVYSVNVVGYANVKLCPGYNLIANPLDNKGAGGNAIENILAGVPDNTTIFVYGAGGFTDSTWNLLGDNTWTTPGIVLPPGKGFWINVDKQHTITFVGDVPQGSLVNPIPAGLSILGSQVPQEGKLKTDLLFPAADGDTVFTYGYNEQCAAGGFGTYNYGLIMPGEWDEEPVIKVGQGFWAVKVAAVDWKRDFTVK